MVPGTVTYFWLTPTRTGTFDVLCFELCGIGHYSMRSTVVVEEAGAHQAWLDGQPTFAKLSARAGSDTGEEIIPASSVGQADSAEPGLEP
jgi:cytochrome c oxidase subunit II